MKDNIIDLSYIDKLKLSGFSPYYKKIRRIEKHSEESKLFGTLKRMYPKAKTFCPECLSPIFETGGECPNCGN